MQTMVTDLEKELTPNLLGRQRLLNQPYEPLLIADWGNLLFVHFDLDADLLQPHIPFPLELFNGRAFVSLVSFQLERLRLFAAPGLTEPLFRPFTRSHFLNVRTYVTVNSEPGIYFLQEFLSNRLSIPFGRPLYGLPYHHATARREIDRKEGLITLDMGDDRSRPLRLGGRFEASAVARYCEPGSEEEFLLERYSAYTHHRGVSRRFRIWHPPWEQRVVDLRMGETALRNGPANWLAHARLVGGHFTGTAHDVWMSRPRRV